MYTWQDLHFSFVYEATLKALNLQGSLVSPRGKPTMELQPCVMQTLHASSHPFLLVKERRLNWAFGLREAAMILAGDNKVSPLDKYNSRIRQFSDDGDTFHGGYGTRLRAGVDQLKMVVAKLTADADSRQAVCSMWDPSLDNLPGKKDYPCNTELVFCIRGQELNLTVVRRSSDIVLGVPYDHVCFAVIQAAIASSLNIKVGSMCEFANSLHYYTELYPKELTLLLGAPSSSYEMVETGLSRMSLVKFDEFYDWFTAYELGWVNGNYSDFLQEVEQLLRLDEWWGRAAILMMGYLAFSQKQFTVFESSFELLDVSFRKLLMHTITHRLDADRLASLREKP